jgi:hypothetical protein
MVSGVGCRLCRLFYVDGFPLRLLVIYIGEEGLLLLEQGLGFVEVLFKGFLIVDPEVGADVADSLGIFVFFDEAQHGEYVHDIGQEGLGVGVLVAGGEVLDHHFDLPLAGELPVRVDDPEEHLVEEYASQQVGADGYVFALVLDLLELDGGPNVLPPVDVELHEPGADAPEAGVHVLVRRDPGDEPNGLVEANDVD